MTSSLKLRGSVICNKLPYRNLFRGSECMPSLGIEFGGPRPYCRLVIVRAPWALAAWSAGQHTCQGKHTTTCDYVAWKEGQVWQPPFAHRQKVKPRWWPGSCHPEKNHCVGCHRGIPLSNYEGTRSGMPFLEERLERFHCEQLQVKLLNKCQRCFRDSFTLG